MSLSIAIALYYHSSDTVEFWYYVPPKILLISVIYGLFNHIINALDKYSIILHKRAYPTLIIVNLKHNNK